MRKIHGVIAAASTDTVIFKLDRTPLIAHYRNFNAPKICGIAVCLLPSQLYQARKRLVYCVWVTFVSSRESERETLVMSIDITLKSWSCILIASTARRRDTTAWTQLLDDWSPTHQLAAHRPCRSLRPHPPRWVHWVWRPSSWRAGQPRT